MNTRRKGYQREKELRDTFNKHGWVTDFKPMSRYQSSDLLGRFDFVAVKEGVIKWIQVKSTKSHYYKARKDIEKWMLKKGLDIHAEVWFREDRGKWKGCYVGSQGFVTLDHIDKELSLR